MLNFVIPTRKKNSYYYNNNIESKWRPIEPIIKYVKVDKTQIFIKQGFDFQFNLHHQNHPSFLRIVVR